MTELELQELDKAVAAKYGIDAWESLYTFGIVSGDYYENTVWLHEDSGRCFDLACAENVVIVCVDNDDERTAYYFTRDKKLCRITEFFKDHNDNKQQAARVAVLKALLAKGE